MGGSALVFRGSWSVGYALAVAKWWHTVTIAQILFREANLQIRDVMSTIRSARWRAVKDRRHMRRQVLSAWVGLVFIAGSVAGTFGLTVGDMLLLAAAGASLLLVATHLARAPGAIVLWSMVYCAVYLVATPFTPNPSQGFQHFLTAFAATGALLLFATFGREMVTYGWFRVLSYVLIIIGVIGAQVGSLAKNGSGGAALYLVALLTIILLAKARRRAALFVAGYFVVAGVLAFTLDLRGLVAYTAVLVVGYICAATLPKPLFWALGIIGSVAVIAATIWYFLNVYTSELANALTTAILGASGRPATSGREWIWPGVVRAVAQENPWFGLGPAALPRDILPTSLSSHSFYLQVYLQLGIAGIILLAGLLLAIWKPLAYSRNTVGYFGAAVFLMFIAHNATEVIMLQNALVAAIPAWCAIGIAISSWASDPPTRAPERPPRGRRRAGTRVRRATRFSRA